MIVNLLVDPVIRIRMRGGSPRSATLPGVLAVVAGGEIVSFSGLRPHQRHAWHAFLVQLGALALIRAGRDTMPADEGEWRALLRGLTPDFPDDEPWCLVARPDKPAFLQPPIPGGLKELKSAIETPDALDMLVTSKNHDLKSEVMAAAEPDDWLFALVTLQTTEGFLGAGNYGVSRINGGFANRPAFSVAPMQGPVSQVRRDIEALVARRRAEKGEAPYDTEQGLGLVWLRPWDGTTSLRQNELDPLYIEICRRVRLIDDAGRISARAGGSKVPRIVPIPGGITGDPWAPIITDKDGGKVLTVDAGGFPYRRVVRLLFQRDGAELPLLAKIFANDADEGLVIIARALTRGQGKTEGLHERRVPITKKVQTMLLTRQTDPLGAAATKRVELAGDIQNRVLKPALLALFENGPDQIDYNDKGAEARTRDYLARFDRAVDVTFFEDLWAEFEEDADLDAIRSAWVLRLVRDVAWPLVVEADAAMSKAVGRRWKALVRAEAVFRAGTRNTKTDLLQHVGNATVTFQPDSIGHDLVDRCRTVVAFSARMADENTFGTGPLADLRRLDPEGALAEPALHRLLARHVSEAALKAAGLHAWALVIHAGALAAPKHLSYKRFADEPADPDEKPAFWAEQAGRAQERFGRALSEANYSERRLVNLLEAPPEDLRIALPRAVRFLVAKGQRLPVLAVADLVMSAGGAEDWTHSVRHHIARGYYRAEAKSEADQKPTKSTDQKQIALGDAA